MGALYNLARVSTTTTGTGTITLGAAVSGFLTFALAGVPNGAVVSYGIKDGANSEVGTGTYTSSGTTLTRTPGKSTNGNAAISLSGAAEVFITARAEDLLIAGNNLSDLPSVSTARTSLGLGTSATVNTGTSGATVPLLNGVNTWSALQTFTGTILTDGYSGRAGTGGATSNAFNLFWTGGAMQLWVDASNLGTINTTSDYRIKKDVDDYSGALDEVLAWRPITYTGREWGVFKANENVRHSFLAHELQAVSPDCVVGEKDGDQPQSLDLIPIISRMAKAIQELHGEIERLKAAR